MSSCLIYLFVYNGEAFVEETLKSVLAQDFSDYRFIVTDDASSDGSNAILERYAKACPERVVYRRNMQNLGVGHAVFECCREYHDAEYLAILGHDDRWAPNYLSSQIACLKRTNALASFAKVKGVDAAGKPVDCPFFQQETLSRMDETQTLAALLKGNFLCGCSGVVNLGGLRPGELETLWGYDNDRLQDYSLWLCLSVRGALVYNPDTFVYYRYAPGTLSDPVKGVAQERFEGYSTRRRALYSSEFARRYLQRGAEASLEEVVRALERLADTQVGVYVLLCMDFCEYVLNLGFETPYIRTALGKMYERSGVLRKASRCGALSPETLARAERLARAAGRLEGLEGVARERAAVGYAENECFDFGNGLLRAYTADAEAAARLRGSAAYRIGSRIVGLAKKLGVRRR